MAIQPSKASGQLAPIPEAESQFSALIYDTSQQVQAAMENMLKMIGDIDQNTGEIAEEIYRSKDFALERKRALDEEKEQFQKAAFAALEMLNTRD